MALWAEYMGAMRRVTELEDRLARKSEAAMREVDDKNSCIARLLDEKAALCEIIGAQADTLAELRVQLAAFTGADPAPADLPDPPRRADGTLAPQPKPWTPPKSAGDTRRIGS